MTRSIQIFARAGAWALLALLGFGPAYASPLLDCPLRDSAYSLETPFIDIMLNEKARATVQRILPGTIENLPAIVKATTAPSFGAIVTLRQVAGLAGEADLHELAAALRDIPVTRRDKQLRCARYDAATPSLVIPNGKIRLLLFQKMTGFRDAPSVDSAEAMFRVLAKANGWSLVVTDRGGAMHPEILKKFDAVIWNNVSGDVLTLSQRKAFKKYIESGGGYLGIHGAAGDPAYFWDWYPDGLIGARFIGHPMNPQFQDARIITENEPARVARGLEPGWILNDEWYSFAKSPRLEGATIVARIDERSYVPGTFISGAQLAMGDDHPIAWHRCVGKGRSFYSAIGHRPKTYADSNHQQLIVQAVEWVADMENSPCDTRH